MECCYHQLRVNSQWQIYESATPYTCLSPPVVIRHHPATILPPHNHPETPSNCRSKVEKEKWRLEIILSFKCLSTCSLSCRNYFEYIKFINNLKEFHSHYHHILQRGVAGGRGGDGASSSIASPALGRCLNAVTRSCWRFTAAPMNPQSPNQRIPTTQWQNMENIRMHLYISVYMYLY